MTDAVAYELKWALFNDMWAVVNSAKAWSFPKKKSHKELVQKAAEDSMRAGKHAKKAEEMGILSGDAIRTLRAYASAAANEVSILSIHGGEFEQKFENGSMLNLESAGVRSDTLFLNNGWQTMIEGIKFGAANIYYTQKGKKEEAHNAKVDMDRRFTKFAVVAKANLRDRDEFNAKLAKEAMEKAEKDNKEDDKAREKAERKAREIRHKWRAEMSKKAADLRKDFFKQQAVAVK
mmetsp:Transcript_121951/g.356358  ORF Transcript_121951/g.356358 Transcript_121951/m.356358 type:complete len:234 (+) Transcript_121951:76-777(+)